MKARGSLLDHSATVIPTQEMAYRPLLVAFSVFPRQETRNTQSVQTPKVSLKYMLLYANRNSPCRHAAVSEIWTQFQNLPYLRMKLGHCQNFQKLPIYSFSTPPGRNRAYFLLYSEVSEIQADFQNRHIWAWNLVTVQTSRSCPYILFLPHRGRNRAYFFALFRGFWNTGRLSKSQYLGMKLGHCQNFQKLPIYSFLPHRGIFGHETWPLAKVPQVAHTFSFSKLSLYSFYGSQFPKYIQIFKIARFRHETWSLAKFQKLHMYCLSTPSGRSTRFGFWDISQFF